MFEFGVSKDMIIYIKDKEGGSREGSGTFVPNINYQGIGN
jgi:hypothetical protein